MGGGSARFELEDGTVTNRRLSDDLTLESLDTQCLDASICNLIELKDLTETSVLHLLRIRFERDCIYTFVSGILIACNPFKQLHIYDKNTIDMYRCTRDMTALPPHVFSIAHEVRFMVIPYVIIF